MASDQSLSMHGIRFAPSQVLGGVRLVPLIRESIRQDLRLCQRVYDADLALVEVDSRTDYLAYIPHGLVANWTTDGSAVFGTQMGRVGAGTTKKARDAEPLGRWTTAIGLKKMVRREKGRQLRFLPLHVAMEGLLALHFGGPSIAWSEYSRDALRWGLSPRIETAYGGDSIVGLEDALRLFEIHENQVGVLVFVGESLASAFVVPHPKDYVQLHSTLLSDFYGELIWQYGIHAAETIILPEELCVEDINSIQDLRRELNSLRARWDALGRDMAPGLLNATYEASTAYRFTPFTLRRFMGDLNPKAENHIGETIYADDGELMYMKTYLLSAAQCRRAFLLKQLASNHWSLEQCSEALGCTKTDLILRLEKAGFGYLLHPHVLDAAHAAQSKRSGQ
jgi:hypothetical protein